jgi:hypothetical protein
MVADLEVAKLEVQVQDPLLQGLMPLPQPPVPGERSLLH